MKYVTYPEISSLFILRHHFFPSFGCFVHQVSCLFTFGVDCKYLHYFRRPVNFMISLISLFPKGHGFLSI